MADDVAAWVLASLIFSNGLVVIALAADAKFLIFAGAFEYLKQNKLVVIGIWLAVVGVHVALAKSYRRRRSLASQTDLSRRHATRWAGDIYFALTVVLVIWTSEAMR
jgi:hypothetical protein